MIDTAWLVEKKVFFSHRVVEQVLSDVSEDRNAFTS